MIRHLLLLIAATTVFYQPISGNSLNIDLALIIHDGIQRWVSLLDQAKDAMRNEFPKWFDIGPNKTRVAILANRDRSAPAWNVWKLTDDQNEMEKALDDLEDIWLQAHGIKLDLATALKMVREEVFVGPTSTKPRVVLLLTFPHLLTSYDQIQDHGKSIRDDDIMFFVAFKPKSSAGFEQQNIDCFNELKQLTGKSANIFTTSPTVSLSDVGSFIEVGFIRKFKDAVEAEMCRYERNCFYSGQNGAECKKGFYTPLVKVTGGDCSQLGQHPPVLAGEGSCDENECKRMCDDLWKWDDCTTKCQTVNRVGTAQWKPLDKCPRTYNCPGCPTTPTKTTKTKPPPQPATPNATVKGQSETKARSSLGLILGISIPIVLLVLIVGGIVTFLILRRKKIICKKKLVFKKIEWRKFIGGLCKKGKKGASKTAPKKGESAKKASPSAKFGKKDGSAKKAEVEAGKDVKKKATVVKSGKESTGKKAVPVGKKA